MVSTDGTDITGATADGVDVKEITIDGVVAWTAGLSEITNYIEDDWGDNSLTNRSSSADGVYATPDGNEAGDVLIGRYRPEWNVGGNGTATGDNGQLNTTGGSSTETVVETQSQLTSGSWEWDISSGGTSSAGDAQMAFLCPDVTGSGTLVDNAYYALHDDTDALGLVRRQSGSSTIIIGLSSNWQNQTSTIKVTRDSYGAFEQFKNGSSLGTTTDTTFEESKIIHIRDSHAIDLTWDNLVIQ